MSTPRKPIDLQVRVAAHVEASRKRDEWARRGLDWSKAGKKKQARVALKKAEFWEAQRKKLEE